jgi:hypothetical protein
MSRAKAMGFFIWRIIKFIFSNLPFIAIGLVIFRIGNKNPYLTFENYIAILLISVVSAFAGYAVLRWLHKAAASVGRKNSAWVIMKCMEFACIGGVYFLLAYYLAATWGVLPQLIAGIAVAILGYVIWEKRFGDGSIARKKD